MNISRTNYTCAKQCYKRLWLNKYEAELAVLDDGVEQRFNTGHTVGEHAWNLFPGGTKVEYNKNISDMARSTRDLLEAGCRVIYEAAFVHENLIAICDILVVKEEGFEIYEVKSSTSMKDVYYDDISFQCLVIKKCGYEVAKACIIHINSQYVRNGEINYNELFTILDVTEKATGHYDESVLPALFPDDDELNYKRLDIKNGNEAMAAFPMLNSMTGEERVKIRKALLEYCKLDTLAMIKILQKLKEAL